METYPELRMAVWAVRQAGDALRSHSPSREELSGSTGGTTEGDLAAERIIVDLISGTFPDHNTDSEESSPTYMTKPRWITDPLDGTANFIIGVSSFVFS